ncbi:MAG: prepilin-type N-terminal cleavage/methylation domain-containing protein [Campylobacterales bacterium]|nr:prepilin-type N-terminal cleavage/methylation domain-containing protein [Campylobacterales bacterium]
MQNNKKAFTMIELVFVIVIIGILSAIAIPKLAATRDDAKIAKAKTTLAAVRSGIGAEKQKRILKGDFTEINDLASTGSYAFSTFNADSSGNTNDVLQYPEKSCETGKKGCWVRNSATSYSYVLPGSMGTAVFTLANNKLTCASGPCSKLE